MSTASVFLRVDQAERRLCIWANAAARRHAVRAFFRGVSRLGDGGFWYATIALMPVLRGSEGVLISLQMLSTGAVGLLLYKLMKKRFVRERPYVGLVGIECAMPPLDRYSFPSGHTLHAVLFAILSVGHVPELAIVVVPFAALVAASRVILGLHYPTDVLVGAAIGASLALGSNALFY